LRFVILTWPTDRRSHWSRWT